MHHMATAAEPNTARKTTVLLVDDESAIALLFEMELTRMGYYVLKAYSGTEAIRVSSGFHTPIDVLVTDWKMPDMSGDKLACELLVQRPEIKVILMSGYPEAEDIAKAFSQDQLVLLTKPFSPAELDKSIRQLLRPPSKPNRQAA
jgi:DNA-binding NtrC family response regulator